MGGLVSDQYVMFNDCRFSVEVAMVTSTTAGVFGRTLVSVCITFVSSLNSHCLVLAACSMPKCKWSKTGRCEEVGRSCTYSE